MLWLAAGLALPVVVPAAEPGPIVFEGFGLADFAGSGSIAAELERLGAARAPRAGRSLRPSWAPVVRCWLRSGIHASAGQQRRLRGTGSPLLSAPHASRRWAWSG